jgi:hypothetical protein
LQKNKSTDLFSQCFFFGWGIGIIQAQRAFRLALLVAHGLCNNSPKCCNLPYGKPPLFESLYDIIETKEKAHPYATSHKDVLA